jgi:uncharacterized Zn finger protein
MIEVDWSDEVQGARRVGDAVTRSLLRGLAGPVIFDRGEDYFDVGAVAGLDIGEERVVATVHGGAPYQVEIRLVDGACHFDCGCPMGVEDDFCKHLVAVGLAACEELRPAPFVADVDPPSGDHPDLRAWLSRQPHERLVELLVEQAVENPELRRRLDLAAAAEESSRIDLAGYRASIADAFSYGGYEDTFVRYADAYGWRRDVDALVEELGDLLAAGFAAETVELAETVLRELEDAVGMVDDSDGHLVALFADVMDLHLAACRQARPEPRQLAERLLDFALHFELDGFLDALPNYRGVLGEEGLTAYRRAAESLWTQVPPQSADDGRSGWSQSRFRITRVMEHLAEVTGDLDELLEVMARDLGSGYQYLRIAKTCRAHGRDDLAVDWAAQGLEAFPNESRLTDFLSELHAEAGRGMQALELERAQFSRAPDLARYRRLHHRAEAEDCWSKERPQALTRIREHIAGRQKAQRDRRQSAWARPVDHSLLVEVLLWEGNADEAWAQAQSGGCSEQLWLRLADARAVEHPADALDVHRRHLETVLQPADNRSYDAVVSVLRTIRPLLVRLERSDEFGALVASIRAEYKRRRNLMQRLDRAGW